jgi:hypothetical protein
MGHLRDRLDTADTGRWLGLVSLPGTTRVAEARRELGVRFNSVGALPAQEELAEVARRLRAAAEADTLDETGRRDWRKAAWCLWLPGHELAELKGFVSHFLERVRRNHRRNEYAALIGAYLREFRAESPEFRAVAAVVRGGVRKWSWVWKVRQERYDLFDPAKAPTTIAKLVLDDPRKIWKILEDAGLKGEFVGCALARAAHEQLLRLLPATLKAERLKPNDLESLLGWSSIRAGQLRFPASEARIAEALLGCWREREPDAETRAVIQKFLLEALGDPRIRAGAARWLGVAEEHKQVLLRWLVGTSLEQFLQIVDQVARPNHWDYRRAFWTAYYRVGAIDEAWVAFSRSGYALAKKCFDGPVGFAGLEGGVQAGHAVLLLRIGGLVIADWSHDGSCRIWVSGNRKTPNFYRTRYRRDDLVNHEDFSQRHVSSERGNWQSAVAGFIRSKTGIALTINQYMPR